MIFFTPNYTAAYTTGYVTKKYIPQRWSFIYQWPTHAQSWVNAIAQGQHQMSPRIRYRFKNNNEVVEVWSYEDRLLVHLLLTIIKPTFKHVISPRCVHLQGPSCITTVTAKIQTALTRQQYGYVIRSDIKSYYASIQHKILLEQLKTTDDDPILLSYCDAIITAGVEQEGEILLPTQGIPLRSSLSPFFGALYLKALDDAFAKCPGIFYLRYMDDRVPRTLHQRNGAMMLHER